MGTRFWVDGYVPHVVLRGAGEGFEGRLVLDDGGSAEVGGGALIESDGFDPCFCLAFAPRGE